MNFEYCYLFIFLFLVGCGVKGDPINPRNGAFPSLLDNYPDTKVDENLNDTEKMK